MRVPGRDAVAYFAGSIVLYQAYYDGGVRLVDVSGEPLGNLADQHREIAVVP